MNDITMLRLSRQEIIALRACIQVADPENDSIPYVNLAWKALIKIEVAWIYFNEDSLDDSP